MAWFDGDDRQALGQVVVVVLLVVLGLLGGGGLLGLSVRLFIFASGLGG